MENNNHKDRSRRGFLSLLVPKKGAIDLNENLDKPAMVKMLTADGKLVQIEKSVLEAATKKQKSTNQEIFQWMNNPSKESHT